MSTRLEDLGGLARRLTLELPAAELERRIEARLAELRRTMRLPGFRPGKVPAAEVRRRAWERVCREQTERLAQAELRAALAAHGLRPVAAPQLDFEDLPTARQVPGSASPRAVATFEVFPPLPRIDLARLELESPEVTVSEADVDRMVDRLGRAADARQPAGGELEAWRRQLTETMEKELVEAVQAERLFLVEQALLSRHPDLEVPASILATTFLFAEVARQRGMSPDPTRLWQRTRELAQGSDDPAAELDRLWGDGALVQEIEDELLRQDVVEAVYAEAKVNERSMSFSELAERRRERLRLRPEDS